MAKRKTPLDRLLTAIEKKRSLSLRELGKTDLYGGTVTADEVTAWYDRLSALARENPPARRVRTLRILENSFGEVSKLEYEYQSEKAIQSSLDGNGEPVFVIESRIP